MRTFKTTRPHAKLVQGRNDWYKIKNQTPDSSTAEIYIYDEIGYFGISAQDFVKELVALDVEKIDLHLNTPGGDAFDGVAIYQALKDHSATVTTIVDSLAASAGSFIAMAGEKIIMQKNAQMMIHDAMGLCIGNAADARELAEMLDRTSDNIASIYAERTGVPVENWRAAMKEETWYTAEEAVEAKLADQVGKDGGKEGTKNSFDLSVFSYAGREKAPAPKTPATDNKAAEKETPFTVDLTEFREALKEAVA